MFYYTVHFHAPLIASAPHKKITARKEL